MNASRVEEYEYPDHLQMSRVVDLENGETVAIFPWQQRSEALRRADALAQERGKRYAVVEQLIVYITASDG